MSINQAFEHFIETGDLQTIFRPTGGTMTRLTPYFTYEVGVDEPPHPDQDIAQRFVEVAMSDCKYGCKIYADPYSEVRVLVHSRVYGCRKTMAVLEEERKDEKIRPGDTVEFPDRENSMITHTGKVVSLINPDDQSYSEKLLVSCQYVVDVEDVDAVASGETYQQAFERLRNEGVKDEKDIALWLGISVNKLRKMQLTKSKRQPFDGNEYKAYDWVKFRFPDEEEVRTGQVMRFVAPTEEPEDHSFSGFHVAVNDSGETRYTVIPDKSWILPLEK
jgi:hypothetical protein